jgi:excinuclease ABC subunit C
MRDRDSELDAIPGVGPRTRQRLLEHFGSVRGIRQASPDAITAVVNATTAEKIRRHFAAEDKPATKTALPILS